MTLSIAPEERVQIDDSRWPVVVVTPPKAPMSDLVLDAFIEEWLALHTRRRGTYVIVNHLVGVPPMSPRHRKKMTDWMSGPRQRRNTCCGTVFVFDSAFMRAALTAVLWMFKPPYPTEVCQTLADALVWSRNRLAEAKTGTHL